MSLSFPSREYTKSISRLGRCDTSFVKSFHVLIDLFSIEVIVSPDLKPALNAGVPGIISLITASFEITGFTV